MSKPKKTSGPLVKQGSSYTDEQRRQAATQYAIQGVLSNIARDMDIPPTTLSSWKQTEWWDDITAEVRAENASRHRATYSQLVEAAQTKALELIPTMTSAKDALMVAAISTDKLRLADNIPAPTNAGSAGALEALARRFEQLARDNRVIQVVDKASDNANEND